MAYVFSLPFVPAFNSNGRVISGARLTFYEARTLTPKAVWTDPDLTVPHSSPVIADGIGRFATIYLEPNENYRVILQDRNGVEIGDIDDLAGFPSDIATPDARYLHRVNNLSDVSMASTARINIGAAPAVLTVEAVSGVSYTFALADAGKHKRFTAAGAVLATVPPNSLVAFLTGTRIRGTAAGAGGVTLAPGQGVAINSRDAALRSAGQFAVFEIEKVAADEWDALGDLAA